MILFVAISIQFLLFVSSSPLTFVDLLCLFLSCSKQHDHDHKRDSAGSHSSAPGLSEGLYSTLMESTPTHNMPPAAAPHTGGGTSVDGQSHTSSSGSSSAKVHSVYHIPTDNIAVTLFYILVFPMKFAIYLTTPDVRRPGSENKALMSIGVVLLWLALQSYVLTVGLTLIGNWWHIPGNCL